jgi:hypothetical protein
LPTPLQSSLFAAKCDFSILEIATIGRQVALGVPMYQLFCDGEKPPAPSIPAPRVTMGWDSCGRDAKTLHRFRRLMSRQTKAM